MKKLKMTIAMCLATVMVMSMMCVGVLADEKNTNRKIEKGSKEDEKNDENFHKKRRGKHEEEDLDKGEEKKNINKSESDLSNTGHFFQ